MIIKHICRTFEFEIRHVKLFVSTLDMSEIVIEKCQTFLFSFFSGRYVKTLWKDIKVGDMVHLSCNEMIPADILVLRSSDEHGLCYIDTQNLDGEANLKQREVPRGFVDRVRFFFSIKRNVVFGLRQRMGGDFLSSESSDVGSIC